MQLGHDPEQGVVLTGLTTTETLALQSLTEPVERGWWSRQAVGAGADPARLDRLLRTLEAHGLLVTGRQGPAHLPVVLVEGSGRVAVVLGQVLEGVARVSTEATSADLVVLVGSHVVGPHQWRPWWQVGTAHVAVQLTGPVVGPLVRPGGPGPCLGCCDRHRTDRDPAWPRLLAQLLDLPGDDPAAGADPLAVATAAVTAGSLVRAHLEGAPAPEGHSWTLGVVPWPRTGARAWSRHPRCPHHRGSPVGRPGAPGAGGRPLTPGPG